MGEVHQIYEEPSLNNTVTKPEQVSTRPIYAKKALIAEMFGCSRSTVYKLCKQAEESGEWPNLSIRPSATVTLINIELFEQYLISINKKFL